MLRKLPYILTHFKKRVLSWLEHRRLRKIIGSNLALALFASTLLPNTSVSYLTDSDVALISQSQTTLTTQRGIQYPTESVKITQGYRLFHPGVDFDGKTGDKIRPIMEGRIEKIEYSRFAYGNSVIINHGNGMRTLYAHLSKINVEEGQEVGLETKLGEMGKTGRASGDHLHLEVWQQDKPINPSSILR